MFYKNKIKKFIGDRPYLTIDELYIDMKIDKLNISKAEFVIIYNSLMDYFPKGINNFCFYPNDKLTIDFSMDIEDFEDLIWRIFKKLGIKKQSAPFQNEDEITFKSIIHWISSIKS